VIRSSEQPVVRGSIECTEAPAPEPDDAAALDRAARARCRAERPTLREIEPPVLRE